MYKIRPGLVIGFHGCDEKVQKEVINGKKTLESSKNDYDWLGHGTYFWEYSVDRALCFANELKNFPQRNKSTITNPAVIGAVINLGKCLDLLDYKNLELLKVSYKVLAEEAKNENKELPRNKSINGSNDLLIRHLDCAVIQNLHTILKENNFPPFDSVRGVFLEGDDLYLNAGFKEKNHIQLCIINPNCIKGYFLPRTNDDKFEEV